MMVLRKILSVLTLTLLLVSCKNENKPEIKTIAVETAPMAVKKELDPNAIYAQAEFTIDGMMKQMQQMLQMKAMGASAAAQRKHSKE